MKAQAPIHESAKFTLVEASLDQPNYHKTAQASLKVVRCESSFDLNAVGDHGLANGPAQFHEETFYRILKAAIRAGEPFQGFTYENPYDQLKLLPWAISHGYGDEWSCYKRQSLH